MRLLLLCAACALAGCDSSGITEPSPAQRAYEQASGSALAAVDAAIGQARADDVAACRLLPLGVNTVGGVTFYRVYSATDVDVARLLSLAERYDEIDRQAIADGVRILAYPAPPPPAVELRDGRCQFPIQVAR